MIRSEPTMAEKIARKRDERADYCERTAGHHKGSVWAINQMADAGQWRAAAARARAGDLTPFQPQ